MHTYLTQGTRSVELWGLPPSFHTVFLRVWSSFPDTSLYFKYRSRLPSAIWSKDHAPDFSLPSSVPQCEFYSSCFLPGHLPSNQLMFSDTDGLWRDGTRRVRSARRCGQVLTGLGSASLFLTAPPPHPAGDLLVTQFKWPILFYTVSEHTVVRPLTLHWGQTQL